MSETPNTNNSQHDNCPNCGNSLKEDFKFCPNCGQTRKTLRITFWSLVKQSLGDLFSYDSKLWHSLLPLVSKPGFLTKEYLEGKRVQYIPPIRLYIFISLIYFVIMGIKIDFGDLSVKSAPSKGTMFEITDADTKRESKTDSEVTMMYFGDKQVSIDTLEVWLAEGREAQLVDTLEWEHSAFKDYMATKFVHKSIKAIDDPRYWVKQIISAASYLMFAMMPLMAVFLLMFFHQNKKYFTEHLIHAFHIHAFLFLSLTLYLILPGKSQTYFAFAIPFIFPFYIYKSLKTVYARKISATIWRTFLLLICGFAAMIFLLISSLLFSFVLF